MPSQVGGTSNDDLRLTGSERIGCANRINAPRSQASHEAVAASAHERTACEVGRFTVDPCRSRTWDDLGTLVAGASRSEGPLPHLSIGRDRDTRTRPGAIPRTSRCYDARANPGCTKEATLMSDLREQRTERSTTSSMSTDSEASGPGVPGARGLELGEAINENVAAVGRDSWA